ELQSALQSSVISIGDILAEHRPLDALDFYQMGLRISQNLLAADSNNDFYLRGGFVARFGTAKCLARIGMRDDAIKEFRRCIEVPERLARFSPNNIVWQIDLADSLYRAALCGDYPKARLTSALTILQRMGAAEKLAPVSRNLKAW